MSWGASRYQAKSIKIKPRPYECCKFYKTAVRGVDKLIPVDLYLPGCPPRPEAIFDAVIKLRKKVANESILERSKAEQTHRYLTVDHKMNLVFSENTGEYLNKKSEKSIESSNLNQIEESSENLYETNSIDNN